MLVTYVSIRYLWPTQEYPMNDHPAFNKASPANVSKDILNRILLILSILTGLGLIATIFLYQKKPGSAAMLLALLTILITAKLLMRRGQLRLSAILTIAGVWLVFGVNILLGGGVYNVNVVFFLVMTVIAGLLFGERATLWVAAASIAAFFCLALLSFFGRLPSPYFVESPWGNLAQLIFAVVTTAGALNLALRERDNALGMAHERLAEQLKVQSALQESEEQYRTIIEQMVEGYFELDLAGNYTFANDAECKISGYSREELIGMNNRQYQDEENANKAYQVFSRIYKTGKTVKSLEAEVIKKDGAKGFIEISVSLKRDAEGKPIGFQGFSRDVTSRKQEEEAKEKLAERLHRVEQMESLGQLAGGVAHVLNNILGILGGYSELLLAEIPEGGKARQYVNKMIQSTERGTMIIQDLLTLARRGAAVADDVVNLNPMVSGFLATPAFQKMKTDYPRVCFRTECAHCLPDIKGPSVVLEKMLMNLVSNAAEAISGEGEVTIRTESRRLKGTIIGHDEVREGDYAVLTVSDTGTGIADENKKKIFEPFYTRKAMGKNGTGLGLSIVWGTVKDHNGYIDVQSRLGEGTTFTVYFPVLRENLKERS